MSWGTELWDQFENLQVHTDKGIQFCEKYAHFIKERCAIENEYATKLKKLVKNHQPKKKVQDENEFTCVKGFQSMVNEVFDIAGQHEVIAENLTVNVFRETMTLIQELKQEKKKYAQDGARQLTMLQDQLARLDKVKKRYDRSFAESEKAQDAYRKADADIHLSRLDVEKAKGLMVGKQQYCESCKSDYASELQKSNQSQTEHYTVLMPQVFQNLQDMDGRRIGRMQDFIRQSAEVERSVIPIINTCIDGVAKAAGSIDSKEDARLVIERYKSGFQPPGDIPFEDLSNANTTDNQNNGHTPRPIQKQDTIKGQQSGGRAKKRTGLLGLFSSSKTDDTKDDYSHLPPNQQKKKLTSKIEGLRSAIAKETAERDGMLKMKDVYVQNPALGDPASLDKQLEENGQKLDKLQAEVTKFEHYLAEADNRNTNTTHGNDNMTSHGVVSGSSPSSVQRNRQSVKSDVTDSGSVGGRDSRYTAPVADQDSFDDEADDDIPAIGTCKALYPFQAQNEGSIAMTEGEELAVVEQDQGDGWTRVRSNTTGDEGFVPTSYIECHYDI